MECLHTCTHPHTSAHTYTLTTTSTHSHERNNKDLWHDTHCGLDLNSNPFSAWHSSLRWCITMFGYKRSSGSEEMIQKLIDILNAVTIDCQIKFGCIRITRSEAIVETVPFWLYTNPHCALDLEDSNPFFTWQPSSWWCVTIPSLVWKG